MRRTLLLGFAVLAAAPATAQDGARSRVTPYIEATQVLDADLKGGDTVTYTSLAAGLDASVDTARATGQVSYRYERRFAWDDDIGDADVHSGLARAAVRVAPGLAIEGGGIATRTRSDIRGAAPGVLAGDGDNISQVYSAYVGPSFAKQAGPVSLNAAYRLGYTKVATPDNSGLTTGQQRLDYYDDSLGHVVAASAGVAPGTVLPVGLTAGAGYERETSGQLHQRYEGWHARGDALLPVSANLAIAGGVGYEKIETSQKDPLRTAAGAPVLDGNGRFVTDPASPQRVAYRTDGVYYDAGVVWRPNRRTSVEGRVGRRYGSTSYTGAISYQPSQGVGLAVRVYDTVTTFGQQLRTGLANLPTSFVTQRDVFAQQFTGCVFGSDAATPGACLNDVFQSISTASYRSRGIDGVLSATRGLSSYGVGAGYSNRRLFAPDVPSGIVLYGLEDQSWYGQVFYSRRLSAVSGVDVNATVNYYEPAYAGSDDIVSVAATASYFHNFGRLSTTATVGLYDFKVGDLVSALSAQALLAARYQF